MQDVGTLLVNYKRFEIRCSYHLKDRFPSFMLKALIKSFMLKVYKSKLMADCWMVKQCVLSCFDMYCSFILEILRRMYVII